MKIISFVCLTAFINCIVLKCVYLSFLTLVHLFADKTLQLQGNEQKEIIFANCITRLFNLHVLKHTAKM